MGTRNTIIQSDKVLIKLVSAAEFRSVGNCGESRQLGLRDA
eukprot:CAMPEP_0114258778 /NCGR_PEP_ID=MMETSP0058-20121206/19519_1 /TAXON_ID=36894 /ORGANISM="Pyramimonas parkeae, CCMP726" /LENGTH=40 /DNA_ID= /DNA_START= /DNA_END= /DNA_ORIENTATION=